MSRLSGISSRIDKQKTTPFPLERNPMQFIESVTARTDVGTDVESPARSSLSARVSASLSQSNSQYDELSRSYDTLTPRLEEFRNRCHSFLRLESGMTVVDNGCGTGKSLTWLSKAVGEAGHVIGLEPCASMLARALERVGDEQLQNVELHHASADALADFVGAQSVDAFLLMFTHDVLQSNAAVAAMLQSAKSGARFALAGGKFYSGALRVLNPWVKARQRPYCTTFAGYDAPWRHLFSSPQIATSEVFERYFGISYVAHCTVK
jgi:SAM-dependent methyltransferase